MSKFLKVIRYVLAALEVIRQVASVIKKNEDEGNNSNESDRDMDSGSDTD